MLVGLFAGAAFAKFEREQLILETQIQERIERILSKTLPPNAYLVTVKVEMDERATPTTIRQGGGRTTGKNPFLAEDRFVLPGVPQKKEFVETQTTEAPETVVNTSNSETLIRRVTISVLVSPDTSAQQIRAIRDVISTSIPFNPLRGDEMDIQPSPLLTRAGADPTPASNASASASPLGASSLDGAPAPKRSGFDRTSVILAVLLAGVTLMLIVLVIFLFGPVRAFLNRLLAVLPRVGEQAAYAVSNSGSSNRTTVNGNVVTNGTAASLQAHNGTNGRHHNGHSDQPFGFVREEQLVKLPLLLKQLTPSQAAIVLAYLPPEWASRVLGTLEMSMQSALVKELSQAKEIPPEAVKEVEAQLKAKLPYWVGGRDWVDTVYQMTNPTAQRALLGSLNQQAPDLAQQLRKKSFFFEDLAVVNAAALRLLVQEAGYPTLAQAIREEKEDFRQNLLRRLPAGTREIVQQELDLSVEDRNGTADAKNKIVNLARQFIADGRIAFGERKG